MNTIESSAASRLSVYLHRLTWITQRAKESEEHRDRTLEANTETDKLIEAFHKYKHLQRYKNTPITTTEDQAMHSQYGPLGSRFAAILQQKPLQTNGHASQL